MKKRIINGIEFEEGSINVYADIGLPDADEMFAKAQITVKIQQAIKARGWTNKKAARVLGLPCDDLVAILRGHFHPLSEMTLRDYLQRLERQPGTHANSR